MSWEEFAEHFRGRYGMAPKLEGLLLMIGLDLLGEWPRGADKVVKQDLVVLGMWRLLVWKGYAMQVGQDAEGWPTFRLTRPIPCTTPEEQAAFLQEAAMAYFAEIWRILGDAGTGNP